MKFQCDQCKSILNSDSVTDGIKVDCPVCGVEIVCHPYGDEHKLKLSKITADGDTDGVEENLSKVIQEKVASAVGIEKLEGFSLSGLFLRCFRNTRVRRWRIASRWEHLRRLRISLT